MGLWEIGARIAGTLRRLRLACARNGRACEVPATEPGKYGLGVCHAWHESPRLFDAIADASLRRIAKFKPQELSALLFAYAKLMHAAPQLLDAIAREGAERIEELEPRSISKMLYSYGKLGHSAPTFFAAAATAASAQMERFNAQELSNLLHGIAKAGVRQADAPLLLDAAVTSVLERIDELSPQDLASISWSLTTSGVRGEQALALYASISSRFTRWLPDLSNHDVATAAWAFGDGGAGAGEAGGDRVYRAASLFDAISLHSLPRLPAFTASELSMLCYAFSAAGHPAPVLFDTIGKEAASRLDEFGLVEMVGLVCSHAHAGLTSPELFAAVADCAPELIVSGGVDMSRQWSRLAWAFATAGDGSRKVFDTITSEAAARVDEIDDADLIRIAWSCAVVDYGAESLFGTPRVVERWARRAAQGKLSEATQLMQLHQWQLWLEERDSPWPRLPAPLAERCLSVSLELEPSRSALQGGGFGRAARAALAPNGRRSAHRTRRDARCGRDVRRRHRGRHRGRRAVALPQVGCAAGSLLAVDGRAAAALSQRGHPAEAPPAARDGLAAARSAVL